MKKRDNIIVDELRLAGASAMEAVELAHIGERLHGLSAPRTDKRHVIWTRLLSLGATAVTFLFIGIGLFILSQASVPGQPMYAVKRASENSLVIIRPGYRENIMMRRAYEVDSLVQQKASDTAILTTLEHYEEAAKEYKEYRTDQQASSPGLIYCKQKLLIAESSSTGPARNAITRTISNF